MDGADFLEMLLAKSEQWLAARVRRCAREQWLAGYRALGEPARRAAVARLSRVLLDSLASCPDATGSLPVTTAQPLEAFVREELQRCRELGYSLPTALKVATCYRQAYLDLVRSVVAPDSRRLHYRRLFEQLFDCLEAALCHQWSAAVPSAADVAAAEGATGGALQAERGGAALAPAKRFFHAAIDALSAHVAILAADGMIIAVNRAWRRFAAENGYPGSRCGLGENYLDVCDAASGDDAGIARQVARGIRELAAGRSDEFHLKYPCHGPGEQRWFQVRAARAEGETVRVAVAHENITEVMRAEEEIVSLNQELEERVRRRTFQLEVSNKELEGFCYSVSHDLRSHLARLEGYGRGLFEDCPEILVGQARFYVERICRISIELRQLIDALLELSRLARCEIELQPVNLSNLVRTVAEQLQREQPQRRARFTIAPEVVTQGDPALLKTVIVHLLDNAWKFTRHCAVAEITFGLLHRHGMATYYVSDNGVGFDMKYAGRLFQPFYRLHSPAEFAGAGIGLATVQRIIQRHGGIVWAEGEVGRGASVYFILRG